MLMTTKDWIQYFTAVAMILSGIALAFLSFAVNGGDIAEGVLWYVAQALTYAGGIFGVSVYFRTKLGDLESDAMRKNQQQNQKVSENDEDQGEQT